MNNERFIDAGIHRAGNGRDRSVHQIGNANNYSDIQSLAQEITEIKKQADELGLFTHERDLLECKFCGLMEDVTFEGFLITYFNKEDIEYHKMKDSGKRFIETNDLNIFLCPECGNNTELPEI